MRNDLESLKKLAAERAADYIRDGMTVGLGTGSTARYLVDKVGAMVKEGMKIRAVATSKATEARARELGIPVLDINDVESIDIAIDGVDEIDPEFNATKGGGGALFREKIVAGLAKEVIWIMDESKYVDHLGRFPLPLEILPYGWKVTYRKLEALGYRPEMRLNGNALYVTDNGNYIADLRLTVPVNADEVKRNLDNTVGVLETGQFLKMCTRIVIGTSCGIKILEARG